MKAKEVMNILGISRITLYTYVKKGYIQVTKLPGGQYNYDSQSVFKLVKNSKRVNVIYARVSTYKQKDDLTRQINRLSDYCQKKNIIIYNIYSEISSGIDFERNQFSKLLDDVINYKIDKIYITNKDRLTRLSFMTIKKIFQKFGTQIVVINNKNSKNDNELFEELISLIHIFSTKMYSQRRKQKLDLISDDLNLEFQKY